MSDESAAPAMGTKGRKMEIGSYILIVLALVMMVIAYRRADGSLEAGLQGARRSFLELLPLLLAVFVVIGFSDVLLPRETIAAWLGKGSGLRGILIASGVGSLIPGGPFVSFPLIAGLYRGGAGLGPVVAFVTAWSLWSLTRLPMEFAILGPRLMLARLVSTVFFPPLAGMIASALFEPRI